MPIPQTQPTPRRATRSKLSRSTTSPAPYEETLFQLCRACQRHIKSATCPFCGSTDAAPLARRPLEAGRLSRSHLLGAVAVAGALTATACGDEVNSATFYGGPPSDYEPGSSSGGSSSGISSGAIYGAPPALDAGEDASSSGELPDADTNDASTDAGEPADASDADVPDAT